MRLGWWPGYLLFIIGVEVLKRSSLSICCIVVGVLANHLYLLRRWAGLFRLAGTPTERKTLRCVPKMWCDFWVTPTKGYYFPLWLASSPTTCICCVDGPACFGWRGRQPSGNCRISKKSQMKRLVGLIFCN